MYGGRPFRTKAGVFRLAGYCFPHFGGARKTERGSSVVKGSDSTDCVFNAEEGDDANVGMFQTMREEAKARLASTSRASACLACIGVGGEI